MYLLQRLEYADALQIYMLHTHIYNEQQQNIYLMNKTPD